MKNKLFYLILFASFYSCSIFAQQTDVLKQNQPAAVEITADNSGFDKANCTFKGKPLYGKVKVVTSCPDIKVKLVDAFPDIKVKWVDAFPDKCGKWKIVDAFPDFTIQFVDAFPDIKVKIVDAFPGT